MKQVGFTGFHWETRSLNRRVTNGVTEIIELVNAYKTRYFLRQFDGERAGPTTFPR